MHFMCEVYSALSRGVCLHCFSSHPPAFLCREHEENGEIKKETKYSYSKLINRKSLLCMKLWNFMCAYFDFCCTPCIFLFIKKGM